MSNMTVPERLEYVYLLLDVAELRKAMASIVSDYLLFSSTRALAGAACPTTLDVPPQSSY